MEIAALLKLAETTVYSLANVDEALAFRTRSKWRIEPADLDWWIDERPRGMGDQCDGEE